MPSYRPRPFLPLSLLLTAVLLRVAHAHTFLTDPEPFNRKYLTESCKKKGSAGCFVACPPYLPFVDTVSNTPDNPPVTWARRDIVTIKWARNTHEGCWSQGRTFCTGRACGSDRSNTAYSRRIQVPSVYRDGTYILSLTWFGGVKNNYGLYPDYRSCSFVRISGGGPVNEGTKGIQPKFKAGTDEEREVQGNVCHAATRRPGECPFDACAPKERYPAFYGVPQRYDGKQPPRLTAQRIDEARGEVSPAASPSTTTSIPASSQSPSTTTTTSTSVLPSTTLVQSVTSTVTTTPSSSMMTTPAPSQSSTSLPTTTPTASISPTISTFISLSSTPSPSTSPSPSSSTSTLPSVSTSTSTSTSPVPPSVSPTPSLTPRPLVPQNAICTPFGRVTVCCVSRCGVCDQAGCHTRSGGSRKCCPEVIADQAPVCRDTGRAPCVA